MLVYLQMIDLEENQSKFKRIYDKYRWLMFSIALKILHNREDAEDALQNAFIAIAKDFFNICCWLHSLLGQILYYQFLTISIIVDAAHYPTFSIGKRSKY